MGLLVPHYLTKPQGLAPTGMSKSRIKLELRITFFPLNKALSLGQLIIPLSSFPEQEFFPSRLLSPSCKYASQGSAHQWARQV